LLVRKFKKNRFPCQFITLSRSPIERALSFVFEDWKKQAPDALKSPGVLDAKRMRDAVIRLLAGDNGVAFPEQWFDRELRDAFGLDVFAEPFDHQQGYQVLRHDCFTLLILRMEDLDRILPEALGVFLNLDPRKITLKRANVGSQKWYAEVYAEVKESLNLPPKVASRVLNSRYCQHFYPEERKAMLDKWFIEHSSPA
jgi:hypothetical protein